METVYYLRDSCALTCSTCTLEPLRDELRETMRHDGSDAPAARRALAVDRYNGCDDVDQLLHAINADASWWGTSGNRRSVDAASLVSDLASDVTHCEHSSWGETCNDCGTQLVEEYVTCRGCGMGEYASLFPYSSDPAAHDEDNYGSGEGPTVLWCDRCEEENGAHTGRTALLSDDGRGYRLIRLDGWRGTRTSGEQHDGVAPIYAAGCRRFTAEEALAHWGSPLHPSRHYAAPRLFAAVLRDAMAHALPRLAV